MDFDFVTVVSGLPRSGTSMMMQALEAGGMPVLTDHIRAGDEDNPRGYYEFELVKKTKTDASWVSDAVGKAVKMVYRLLYDLPEDYEYRVIFMRRNIDEIMLSQKIMLERTGKKGANISSEELAELFKRDLEKVDKWIAEQNNFSIISVNYKEMVESPLTQCQRVNEFLTGNLDVDKMLSVVDTSLYRNRK
ncbi:sulfotransferase family protein [Planctomycetota bacterium]